MKGPELLFLFYEKANFPTIEPVIRKIECRSPGRAAFVKGFDFKEASGEIPPWNPPADIPLLALPEPSAPCLNHWLGLSREAVPLPNDPLAQALVGAVLKRPYVKELRQRWAQVAAATETLLIRMRPRLVILPEDTDYIRGRLAGRIAREQGLTTVVLSAHYYDRWQRYPLAGARYADHFLVLNDLSASRLSRAGVARARIHIVGNPVLTLPCTPRSEVRRLLLCEQNRPEEEVWVRDVLSWAERNPETELWIRPHPEKSSPLVNSLLPANAKWAPPASLESLLTQVRAVVGETSTILWQASAAGLPVVIVHYAFGPSEIALPPGSGHLVARTRLRLHELLDGAAKGECEPLSRRAMVSDVQNPVDETLSVLNSLSEKPVPDTTTRKTAIPQLRWIGAALFFCFSLLIFDGQNPRSSWIGATLLALPLLLQWAQATWIRRASLWFGLFLFLQCLVSPWLVTDLRRNAPNLSDTLNFDGHLTLAGIQGVHRRTTDAQGFRVTKAIDYSVKQGPRIFTIGASTTECAFLDDQKTWPALLEKKLARVVHPKVEVINVGVDGTRIRHQYAMLKKVMELRPDLIVLLPGVNDWNLHIRETFTKSRLPSWQRIQFKNSLLGQIGLSLFSSGPAWKGGLLANSLNLDPYQGLRRSLDRVPRYDFFPKEVSADYSRYLEHISQRCREARLPCLFMTQPSAYATDNPPALRDSFWMTPFNEDYTLTLESMIHLKDLYNGYLRRVIESAGQPFLDLALEITPSQENFFDDVHFNETGAEHVASAIAEHLIGHRELLATPLP